MFIGTSVVYNHKIKKKSKSPQKNLSGVHTILKTNYVNLLNRKYIEYYVNFYVQLFDWLNSVPTLIIWTFRERRLLTSFKHMQIINSINIIEC